jgi:hypothetical protein
MGNVSRAMRNRRSIVFGVRNASKNTSKWVWLKQRQCVNYRSITPNPNRLIRTVRKMPLPLQRLRAV